jgi:hypothetical protein
MFGEFSRAPQISYGGQKPAIEQNVRKQTKPKASCHANKNQVLNVHVSLLQECNSSLLPSQEGDDNN